MRKLFDYSRSEPDLPADDMASEIAWMNAMEQKAWRKACQIAHDLLFILFCVGLIWFFCYAFAGKASAAVNCDDPGLAPELKKACYQMKEACEKIGCSVSVR